MGMSPRWEKDRLTTYQQLSLKLLPLIILQNSRIEILVPSFNGEKRVLRRREHPVHRNQIFFPLKILKALDTETALDTV